MTCCAEQIGQQFDGRVAQRELKRFRARGADVSTRAIIAAVAARPFAAEATVLDIGGGVGAIHHALLDGQFASARHVDASEAYLAAAAAEAARLGHQARVEFLHGDFAALADRLPAADLVTLDRVVCCDPDYARLLGAAAAHARQALAFSYPRPRRLIRGMIALANAFHRLLRRPFRIHLHPPAGMHAVLERAGLRPRWSGGTWFWAVELFDRAA